MRLFWFDRQVDESKVSGVGKVAQGVEFDDGTCVLRWLTANRSTAIYANIQELEKIHSHGGQTKIVWETSDDLVEITKPHLALGAEGPDAERIAAAHNVGPVLPGARAAYDRIGSIKAPRGWTAYATFYVGGAVCLRLLSASTRLHDSLCGDLSYQHYYRRAVELLITADKIQQVNSCRPAVREEQVEIDGRVFFPRPDHYASPLPVQASPRSQ